ncbi:MAG TPA: hypothetical protein VF741_07000 [Candidatus Aquilonibacter sp.]
MRCMRATLFALLSASMTVLATVAVSADPTSDMAAMTQAFAGVHSFHADITTSRGTMGMDMIVPDKFHMTMNDGKMQLIKIGNDIWMNSGKGWQHVPMAGGMMQRPLDMARNAGMSANGPKDYTITDLGPAVLDGVATHKYHMVPKNGDAVDMWIATNLPVQVQTTGSEGTATIKYSQYNSVPDITPPN